MHDVWPAPFVYWPTWHAEHADWSVAPLKVPNVPASHNLQLDHGAAAAPRNRPVAQRAHVPVFVVEAPVISCPGAHCSPHESHISPEQLRVARNVPCVHVVQAPADVGDANGLNEPASQHFHGWHSAEPFALVNDATHAWHAAALPWRSRGLKVPTSHSTHPEEPAASW
jgi:hypothetical protein